jgi:hypothetical protein
MRIHALASGGGQRGTELVPTTVQIIRKPHRAKQFHP